jgi:hypothetical protein
VVLAATAGTLRELLLAGKMFEHKSMVVLVFFQYLFGPIQIFLIRLALVEILLVIQSIQPFVES